MSRPQRARRSAYRHFRDITTRWMDNDVYAHVNNVVYYSWFDTAVNGYLVEQRVLDFKDSAAVGLVVETGCTYFAPVAFPDLVRAGVRVAHVGASSVRYEVALFANDDDEAAAQGHFLHVYVSRETRRPMALPADLRRALEAITSQGDHQ
jgi:acyl-CoA thioester hydrolase